MSTSYHLVCSHQGQPEHRAVWPSDGVPSYARDDLYGLLSPTARAGLAQISPMLTYATTLGALDLAAGLEYTHRLATLCEFMASHGHHPRLEVRDEYELPYPRPGNLDQ